MSALEPMLQRAGFTEYEAKAYVCLLTKSPQTGYELAKNSGIPRGNIYTVLQKLTVRGAATKVASPDGVKYAVVSPQVVMQRMKDAFEDVMEDIERAVETLHADTDIGTVESFEGYENLMSFLIDAVKNASSSLIVAFHSPEMESLYDALRERSDAGLQCETLCLEGCEKPCPGCIGTVRPATMPEGRSSRWAIAVIDERYLLAGEIRDEQATCIRTQMPIVVKMAAAFLRQSAALARFRNSSGMNLTDLTSNFLLPQV